MKPQRFLLALLAAPLLLTLTSCSETDDSEDPQYADWQTRNEAYFKARLAEAHTNIAQAQAAYGTDWEAHTPWRAYRVYSQASSSAATWEDSVAVYITKSGTGSGCPLYTDSVRVNYTARLIPNALATQGSEAQTRGFLVSYSGSSRDSVDVFSEAYGVPAKFAVSNTIAGFTTALQHMHIGDQWRLYIPAALAYESSSTTGVPAYSTIVYDVQLKAYYRPGESVPDWK